MDVIFNCSNCNQELEVDEAAVGQQIDCPSCGNKLTIPPPDPNRKPQPQSPPTESGTPAETKAADTPLASPTEPAKPAEGAETKPPPPEPKKEKGPIVVPHYDKTEEIRVKKTEVKETPKDQKKIMRVRSIRRNQCVEVGHDLFDEKVTEFIQKVGEENIQSITPVSYAFIDTQGHNMADYGVLIIYKG